MLSQSPSSLCALTLTPSAPSMGRRKRKGEEKKIFRSKKKKKKKRYEEKGFSPQWRCRLNHTQLFN
jgi:hypothetical protein